MANAREVYGSGDNLNAKDMPDGRDVALTIKSSRITEFEDGERKIVLSFERTNKELILNVTNANSIISVLGTSDTDQWNGQRIVLYKTKTDYQGKRVDAVRVREQGERAAAPARESLRPQLAPEPVFTGGPAFAGALTDEDIPF